MAFTIGSTIWPERSVGFSNAKITILPPALTSNSKVFVDRIVGSKIRLVDVNDIEEIAMRRIGETGSFSVSLDGGQPIVLRMANMGAAFRALQKCRDALTRSWGVDPTASYALKSLPVAAGQHWGWLTGDDYPDWAVLQNKKGKAVVRLLVDPQGMVRRCDNVVSTGDTQLDRYSCTLIMRRAHYHPAIDLDDKPVSAQIFEAIRWVLP